MLSKCWWKILNYPSHNLKALTCWNNFSCDLKDRLWIQTLNHNLVNLGKLILVGMRCAWIWGEIGSLSLICHNLSPGLATKARGWKVAGQEGDLGIISHAPMSAKSVRAWTLTLPSEFPCWELESQKDSRIFRALLQGSKPISLKNYLYY